MIKFLFYIFVLFQIVPQSSFDLEEFLEACERGNLQVVKDSISSGVKVNQRGTQGKFSGKTALMVAAMKGKKEIVRILISNGADLNYQEDATGSLKRQAFDGFTALLYAADSDQEEVVKILVNNGANVNQKSKTGISPLSLAKLWQNDDMIRALKNAGAVD